MNNIVGFIYKIHNNINEKIYIGQTKSQRIDHGKIKNFGIQDRFNEHKQNYNKKKYCNRKLYQAMNEIGINNFHISLVEEIYADLNLLDKKELEYIKQHNSIENGYNETYFSNRYNSCDNLKRIKKIKNTMKEKWKKDPDYQKITKEKNLEAVEKRAIEGKTRKKENKDLPPNIYNHTRNDGKIGYDIRILRDGKYKITSVTKNISQVDIKNKKEIMKNLLEKAIIRKNQILSELINNSKNDNIIIGETNNTKNDIIKKSDVNPNINIPKMDLKPRKKVMKKKDHNNSDLPMYLNRTKYKNNDGYVILIKNKNYKIKKTFTNSYLTMDEKLNNAKKELQNILLEMTGQSAGEK